MLTSIASATLTQEEMTQLRLGQWIDKFLAYCESPLIRYALSRDRYSSWNQPQLLRLQVSTERRLLQLLDGALIRGVIDRCVLGLDGDRVVRAEILDFKTDQRGEGEELATWIKYRKEVHAPQLNAYRRVLCRQFSLHPDLVQSTLILLSENKVESVDNDF
jgi:ATP-dependent exoDNAse (exonuclease V) beta subunit